MSAPAPQKLWPSRVSIFEVGPRDGLQAEFIVLGVAAKAQLIVKLVEAGMPDVEVGSFVKAERIPQLQNTDTVIREAERLLGGRRGARFWAFVPNEFGLQRAIEHKLDGASFFVGASDTFCHKNVNRGREEILIDLQGMLKIARREKIKSRVYLSTLVHCPYEGPTKPATIAELVDRIADMGASEIVLSDTTGHATPLSIAKVCEAVLKGHPAKLFALHLHDTRGLALANILESMRYGLSRFDSSVAGMGGCPYAPGASGNLATEDLLYMVQQMGLEKKIDLAKVAEAGKFAENLVSRVLPSRVLRTFDKKTA